MPVDLSQALDIIGNLIASLKQYASKLPARVPLASVPGGIKPTPESIESYENAVSRFRSQSGSSVYKKFHDPLIESLEAFEAGKLLGSVQPLLAVLDHLDVMKRDKLIAVSPPDEKRVVEYRTALHKILPGNKPELEGAGRGM
ncbi:MAG: hypothetical protein A3H49_04345 [Nitrospirae bacterium RIFCSPLOWO2_02_FULL_62_14]|nr:MAG: hypothetical protein A3H49_04345 [Nitrospirae bacterium RIFCSPLOWO2_02_FULL_62_14]OGW68846.1 MAG: hypothetical protein A3A88_10355 [Nitrospirae bacterium RIFCSPLOWO2_01_FULL_62_17]